MVLQCWSIASYPNSTALFSQPILTTFSDSKDHQSYNYNKFSVSHFTMPSKSFKTSFRTKITCVQLGLEDINGIAHNKVLIAAGVSAAIGQFSKPFTSVLLYGKDFNFKAAIQAGGFPSTHSSAVVASATSLALERGFSDSIFGLTVVYAGLVMYDAQGVRREVGNHAKLLNKVVNKREIDLMVSTGRDDIQQRTVSTIEEEVGPLLSEEGKPYVNELRNSPFLLKSENKRGQATQMLISSSTPATEEEAGNTLNSLDPLKESIGHTEVEVISGALLGFFLLSGLRECSIGLFKFLRFLSLSFLFMFMMS